jgi:cyclic beta-1,2-glucan synthetase
LTLLLVSGWYLLPSAWLWTLSVLGIVLVPSVATALLSLLQKPGDVPWSQHLAAAARAAGQQLAQAVFTLVCLPFEAFFSLDAIVRTAWRMRVSHRRLLEWTPSGDLERAGPGLVGFHRTMWAAPTLAFATALGLAAIQPTALPVAAPILLLWLASPTIAWWLGRPLARRRAA